MTWAGVGDGRRTNWGAGAMADADPSECACFSGAGPGAGGKACVSEGVRGDARVPDDVDASESWSMSTSVESESELQREEGCAREGEGEAWERI